MDRVSCPRCGRAPVAPSHLVHPASPHAAMAPRWACPACGLAWTEHDPARLRAAIRDHGGELGRQLLDEVDGGPLRDLPDTAAAREVAAWLAELDDLARVAAGGRVARRFHELTGTSWDEAIAATRHWHRLSRPEKLAHLGWEAKKAGPGDDLAGPLA